jgi:membrane-bound inhibitor of C-type lysozyme
MRFPSAGSVGVLIRDGKSLELQERPAASGIWYTDGTTTVRGKGNDITIEGRVALTCKAQ